MAEPTIEMQQAWRAPVLVRVNVETPDGRLMRAIDWRELPLPLKWQKADTDGHDQSIIVGRIDTIEMADDTTVTAAGVFDTSPDALEAARLVAEQMLRGVSVDPGGIGAVEVTERDDGSMLMEFESYTIGGATLVAIPAFPDAAIQLIDDEGELAALDEAMGHVTELREALPDPAGSLSSLLASATPLNAPEPALFTNPGCTRREPLHVEPDGRVWGHLCGWGECHIGSPPGRCITPPRSFTHYAYFRTGSVLCADGTMISTGPVTLGGTHASKRLGWQGAHRHYEDTTLAVADVACGEDDYGIWVAGMIRPGTDAEKIHELRASCPSGDWRQIGGNLELVAAHVVNMPGFPPISAYVDGGRVLSLIASGALAEGHSECGCGGASITQIGPDLAALAERVEEVHRIVTAPIRAQALADMDDGMTLPGPAPRPTIAELVAQT